MFVRLVFLFLFLTPAFCDAQTYVTRKTASGKVKKNYEKALRLSFEGSYEKALGLLDKVIEKEPRFIDAHIEQAKIWYDQRKLAQAEGAFEYALGIDPVYEIRILYFLGLTEFRQEKFAESLTHFQAYLDAGPKKENLKKNAINYIADAEFRDKMQGLKVPFDPINLGDSINTPSHEYLPSLSVDGQIMIYTAVVNRQEDFYYSEWVNGAWSKGKPLNGINTPGNEGAQNIAANGKLLIFTACRRKGGFGSCDLYYSEFKNGKWTPAANMGTPINSNEWEAQPALSADGQRLYFTSTRKGGMGMSDLWLSTRNSDGSWGVPQNLGPTINTEEKDESPFIHPDGQTLYFMSQGHPGFGGFDLYYARLKADGEFAEPENLGAPINTSADEGAFIVSLDGKTAYFASDRPLNESRGKTDIYQFELYEAARPKPVTYVKAQVYDADTSEPLEAEVQFQVIGQDGLVATVQSDEEGEFLTCLLAGADYALNVSKEGYLFYSDNFALADTQNPEDPFLIEIPLQRIPTDPEVTSTEMAEPIILKNVFFETGSAELLPVSLTELNRLRDLLERYPQLAIQINGHTDNVGQPEDNLNLSESRAQSVYRYLIDQGIAAERLTFKGYGETKPIASNETKGGRQQNRRTEFVITGR